MNIDRITTMENHLNDCTAALAELSSCLDRMEEFHAKNKNLFKDELEEIIDCLDECGEVLRAKGIVENADGGLSGRILP